jgi:hypothetical protein
MDPISIQENFRLGTRSGARAGGVAPAVVGVNQRKLYGIALVLARRVQGIVIVASKTNIDFESMAAR